MSQTVKSDLYPAGGPSASPVPGIKTAGHLRVMNATYQGAALASGDIVKMGKLPPGAMLIPELCKSGTAGTIKVGETTVTLSGAPVQLPEGGEVTLTVSATVALNTAVRMLLVYAVMA